jgi:hypothetical protein
VATKKAADSVSWRWLAGIAISVLILAGAGWLTYVQNQIGGVQLALDGDRKQATQQAVDTAVTKKQVENLDRKVDDVQKDVRDIRSDIKQILNNQMQQLVAPAATKK